MEIPKDYFSNERNRGKCCAVVYGETKQEVEEKVKKYLASYPPQGYSTYIAIRPSKSKDGYWFARLERWANCE